MTPAGIVEGLDVFENAVTRVARVLGTDDSISVFIELQKLSIGALSQQSPFRLMLEIPPIRRTDSWNGTDVYWHPRSE